MAFLLFAWAVLATAEFSQAQDPEGGLLDDSRIVVRPEAIDRILFPGASESWNPRVARFRGGTDLYSKVAPAVVVVRSQNGHGTGFLVGSDGWVVTNHHVVASGLTHDPVRQASYATVHLGSIGADGSMTVQAGGVRAYVYRMDRLRDLALLKMDSAPPGLAHLTLATAPPRPGMSVSMVGHPSSGMLWTFRTGQVSASGRAPTDLVDTVMARLAAAPTERESVAKAIRALPSRKIILSSCEANPGDSGGPLVDENGQVVAVTFAIPVDPTEAKFTYHVHLDELRAVIENRPARPVLVTPDPWDAGARATFKDFDGDRKPDTLVLGAEQPEMFLVDLSGRTSFAGLAGKDAAYEKLVSKKGWSFDFAWRVKDSEGVAFYDTDRDGIIDTILVGADPKKADVKMRRVAGGAWRAEPATGPVLSLSLLGDAVRQKKLGVILAAMENAGKANQPAGKR